MTPLYAGIGGVVRELTEMYTGIGGVVKPMTEMWAGVSGVERQIFSAVTEKLASEYSVGDILNLEDTNGQLIEYVVVNQGIPDSSLYDSSCDGTWLLRRNLGEESIFGSTNAFSRSTLLNYLKNTVYSSFSQKVKNSIKTVKIPYTATSGSNTVSSGANGLSCNCFALSCAELGFRPEDSDSYRIYVNDGAKLAYFECGKTSSAKSKRLALGQAEQSAFYHTRSQKGNGSKTGVLCIGYSGSASYGSSLNKYNVRDAIVLNKNTVFNENTNTIL